MRKALIAVIVASALFAVGAFAAELTVQSDDVASGQEAVTACGDANVEWETDAAVDAAGEWSVTGATVTFNNANCDGAAVDLAVGLSDTGSGEPTSWQDWSCAGTVTSQSIDCDPPAGSAPDVFDVVDVAVLANGNSVDAFLPAA